MAGSRSDYLILKQLDGALGGTNFTQPATVYLALFTDTNTQAQRRAGTVTEPSGNAYARLAITNNATNWPAASSDQKQNGTALTMATPSPSGWGVAVAFGLYDASSAGNLLYWGDLLGTEKVYTVDATGVTSDLLTSPAHGLVANDKIKISSIPGTTLPAGLTDGAYYFVISTGLTTDAFKVSTTQGGSAVDITAAGGGKWGKTQEQTISANVPPSFAINALTISES